MSVPLRSHISVRSYFFRQICAEAAKLEAWSLDDFRIAWINADTRAHNWRRQATNRWNDQTKQWEQR